MNHYKRNFGFTLIELMIVITILGIISLATYLPYAHHQKKTLVKQAVKELSQTLSESRNLAIHGLDTGSGNVYVGLRIEPGSENIDYYTSTGSLTLAGLPSDIYKTKALPKGVEILSLNGDDSSQVLISFAPITGSGQVTGISDDVLTFIVAFKGTSSPALQKELIYYRKSFISDY